jgi:hypothetical protein
MGNRANDWLESETDGESMHPSQFEDFYGSHRNLSAEQVLIQAVIDQALCDLKLYGSRAHRGLRQIPSHERILRMGENTVEGLWRDVVGWFLHEGDEEWSFRWCCHRIPDHDPDRMVELLQKCNWYPARYESIRVGRPGRRTSVNGEFNAAGRIKRSYVNCTDCKKRVRVPVTHKVPTCITCRMARKRAA